jgi:thiamine-phosphate diphosphorylase
VNASLAFAIKYNINRIHLSQENVKKIKSKKELKNIFFGISVHSLNEIESALRLKSKYLLVSPVFKTNCKSDKELLGIEFLKAVQSYTDIPLIALGGINDENIIQLNRMNITNVAMRSNLLLQELDKTSSTS